MAYFHGVLAVLACDPTSLNATENTQLHLPPVFLFSNFGHKLIVTLSRKIVAESFPIENGFFIHNPRREGNDVINRCMGSHLIPHKRQGLTGEHAALHFTG